MEAQQEEIYAEMNRRNSTVAPHTYDATEEPTKNCIAAWTGGSWHLEVAYSRLINRLQTLAGDYLTFFWPERAADSDHGILHQTLLQVVGFDRFDGLEMATIPIIIDAAASLLGRHAFPLTVAYRGLVWTPTGLALAGYTADFDRLCSLRDKLGSLHGAAVPYKNNIVHATIARWHTQPPPQILALLRNEVVYWSETVFGHLTIRSWTVGICTLLMHPVDRYDRCTVRVPLLVYHRGNSSEVPTVENNPNSLSTAVAARKHVELDIWLQPGGVLFVGHDGPDTLVSWSWLKEMAPRALIHCKDGATFVGLKRWFGERGIAADLFYHTTEDYALSTGGKIIVYPGRQLFEGCLDMMPELCGRTPLGNDDVMCGEICSDKLPLKVYDT